MSSNAQNKKTDCKRIAHSATFDIFPASGERVRGGITEWQAAPTSTETHQIPTETTKAEDASAESGAVRETADYTPSADAPIYQSKPGRKATAMTRKRQASDKPTDKQATNRHHCKPSKLYHARDKQATSRTTNKRQAEQDDICPIIGRRTSNPPNARMYKCATFHPRSRLNRSKSLTLHTNRNNHGYIFIFARLDPGATFRPADAGY